MYWNNQTRWEEHERALGAYLLQELEREASLSPGQRELFRQVTHSVAVFCSEDTVRGVPSDYVHMLLSRALWSVGESTAAERLMNDHVERRAVKQTFQALLALTDVSPILWKAVVCGAVRRSEDWISAGGTSVWMVNLSRIRMTPCDMELARFLTVRTLIQSLAPVWDATGGGGALSLRVSDSTAFSLSSSRNRSARSQARDVMTYCLDLLVRESRQRAWRTVPRLFKAA